MQVHATIKLLITHLSDKITLCLAAGGLDVKSQEASLRSNPDIVIATPGRLIDHIYNAPSWSIHSVEVLILDEADRILEENFEEQLDEISKQCSREKQTLMFSATMTEKVKDLERMCLKNPKKIFINDNTDVSDNLKQQFVRLRDDSMEVREATVSALVKRSFSLNTLIFVKTKNQCHRLNIHLGLQGLRSGELHGDMKQKDRLDSLRRFKKADIDILVCTDLASRGLDIPIVENVINFRLPSSYKTYVHRVGRTARAGKSGQAVSLVSEKDRTIFEKIIKMNKKNKKAEKLENRTVPKEVINEYLEEIKNNENSVENILKEEEEEKHLNLAEKDLNKLDKKMKRKEEEIKSLSRREIKQLRNGKKVTPKNKPMAGAGDKRSWFQQHHERSGKEVDNKKRKLPKVERNKKGSFNVDLSDTSQKTVKNMRKDAGMHRKRRK